MSKKVTRILGWIASVLVIIGAINWLAVAISPAWNLVQLISMGMGWFERLVYALVGLSGLYMIYFLFTMKKK